METVILWCGFVGGWLLVAGPVFQASLELEEESAAREVAERAMSSVEPPAPVSPWWWLLPPAHLYLQRRATESFQHRLVASLAPDERERLIAYIDKAWGWMLVGAGGTLIATKETWELHEHFEWPGWVFWVLVVGMLWLSVLHSALQQRRKQQQLGRTPAPRRRRS